MISYTENGKPPKNSKRVGDSDVAWTPMGGLQVNKNSGDVCDMTPSQRFKVHKVQKTSWAIFGVLLVIGVALLASGYQFLTIGCLVAGIDVAWAVWSFTKHDSLCEIDRETGLLSPTSDAFWATLGSEKAKQPFVDWENKLRKLVITAPGLPNIASDENMSWTCVEISRTTVSFEVHCSMVFGLAQFWTKNLDGFATYLGDADGADIRKLSDGCWRVTFDTNVSGTMDEEVEWDDSAE